MNCLPGGEKVRGVLITGAPFPSPESTSALIDRLQEGAPIVFEWYRDIGNDFKMQEYAESLPQLQANCTVDEAPADPEFDEMMRSFSSGLRFVTTLVWRKTPTDPGLSPTS
jgi:hypothetical protein